MARESEALSGLVARAGLLFATVVAATLVAREPSLTSGRPVPAPGATAGAADGVARVPDRFSFDPFAGLSAGTRLSDCDALADEGQRAAELVVFTPALGGEDSAEIRRRRRGAVAAALDAADYVSDGRGVRLAGLRCLYPDSGSQEVPPRADLPVAFETFSRACEGAGLAVFWVPEEQLAGEVPEVVARLRAGGTRRVIVGPGASDALGALLAGTRQDYLRGTPAPGGGDVPPLLDFGATADLQNDGGLCEFGSAVCGAGTFVRRVVPPDSMLLQLMRETIERDHLAAGPVVLLTEGTSRYGVTFRTKLETALRGGGVRFLSYTYASPLDGASGDPARARAAPEHDAVPAEAAGLLERRGDPGEIASGERQADAVRRLGTELARVAGREGLAAVVIIGGDVYDKRMLLRELRPLFPAARFVTTDLDARLLESSESAFTRGLVVATAFGLAPDRGAFGDRMPPFRDSYATGAFIATRLALLCLDAGSRLGACLRGQPDMTREAGQRAAAAQAALLSEGASVFQVRAHGGLRVLARCPQPVAVAGGWRCARAAAEARLGWRGALAVGARAALGGGIALLLLAATRLMDRGAFLPPASRPSVPPAQLAWWRHAALTSIAVAACCAAWPAIRDAITAHEGVAAADRLGGESLWAIVWLRVAILIYGVWLYRRVAAGLDVSLVALTETFGLGRCGHVRRLMRFPCRSSGVTFSATRAAAVLCRYLVPRPPVRKLDRRLGGRGVIRIATYWRVLHVPHSALWARFLRTVVASLIAWAGLAAVAGCFDIERLPALPPWLGVGYVVSLGGVLLMLLVSGFLVVDATLNAIWVILDVGKSVSVWPEACVRRVGEERGLAASDVLHDVVDLDFFAARAEVLLPLAYAPFSVLALFGLSQMLASRFVVPTVAEILGEILVLGALVGCVVCLRLFAERVRGTVRGKVQAAICRALGETAAVPSAEQLRQVLESVTAREDGAFAPLAQQPLLKAFALPVGAYVAPLLSGVLDL